MTLLDSHVLLWLDAGSSKLGTKARRRVDRALKAGQLGVSAITFWEVAMLERRGRVRIPGPVDRWRQELLRSGLQEVAVSGAIGIRAAQLDSLHGDPADRIIVATAELGKVLVTADTNLLEWDGSVSMVDAGA